MHGAGFYQRKTPHLTDARWGTKCNNGNVEMKAALTARLLLR